MREGLWSDSGAMSKILDVGDDERGRVGVFPERKNGPNRFPSDPPNHIPKHEHVHTNLPCKLNGACLANHDHLYFSRVLQFCFYLRGNVLCERERAQVIDRLRFNKHAHLASSLYRIDFLDAFERRGGLLQRLHALNVLLERTLACAWACARNRICRFYNRAFNGARTIFVVSDGLVTEFFGPAEFFHDVVSDLRMRALHVMIHGFSDIVEEPALLAIERVGANLSGDEPRNFCHLNRMLKRILPVGRSILKATQDLHQLRVDGTDGDAKLY